MISLVSRLLATLLLGAVTQIVSASGRTVFFEARIQKIEIVGIPSSTNPLTVEFGMYVHAQVEVTERLIGGQFYLSGPLAMRMASEPVGERLKRINVLAVTKDDGNLDVLHWDYAVNNFCLEDDTAKALGIETQMNELYRSGRVRCHFYRPR